MHNIECTVWPDMIEYTARGLNGKRTVKGPREDWQRIRNQARRLAGLEEVSTSR